MYRVVFTVFVCLFLRVELGSASEPSELIPFTPVLAKPRDVASKRRSIELELEQNIEAVKQIFDLIDHTPESDVDAREFFDQQIEQFDQRSEILHDELNKLDEIERWQRKKSQLRDQAELWVTQAAQLRKQGHLVPAALFELKSKSILGSLADGTWRLLVESKQESQQPAPQLATVLKMDLEIATLKNDAKHLRDQVVELQDTVRDLESKLEELARTTKKPRD